MVGSLFCLFVFAFLHVMLTSFVIDAGICLGGLKNFSKLWVSEMSTLQHKGLFQGGDSVIHRKSTLRSTQTENDTWVGYPESILRQLMASLIFSWYFLSTNTLKHSQFKFPSTQRDQRAS